MELVGGRYKLPDFQRNYVWNKQQIMDLLDSLYKNIFIGVPSVVWYESSVFQSENSRESNESPMRLRDLWARGELYKQLGLRPRKLSSISLVIDGQQRLTSILYIFYCETLALGSGRQTEEERHSIKKVKELVNSYNDITEEDYYEDKSKRKNNFVIFIRHDDNLSDLEVSFDSCEIKGNGHKNSEYDELKKRYLTTQELYDLYLDIKKKGKSIDSQEVKDWIKNREQFSWIKKDDEQFRKWIESNKEKLRDWINKESEWVEDNKEWEKLKEWIESREEYLRDMDVGLIARRILELYARKISDACTRLFSQYKIDMLEIRLSPSVPTPYALLNTLAITFDRINSKGIRIELFDIAVAAFYKYGNIRERFKKLQDDLDKAYKKGKIPFLDSGKGIRGEDILRIMALILRVTVKRAEILGGIHDKVQIAMEGRIVETIGKRTLDAKDPLSDVWEYARNSYIKALERLREEYGVYSFDPSKQKSSMPYGSMLPVLAAFLHVAEYHPNARAHKGCVEAMIDFWYWISVFAERYSSSADTTSETDVNQFHDWVNSLGTGSVKLPNFFNNYCGKDIPIDLAKTKQGQAIFRGILNIIYKEGALDWSDDGGKIPQLKHLSPKDLNQDHIFPKSPKDIKYPESVMEIPIDTIKNSILNVTLISEGANKKKKSKAPSKILTDLRDLRSKYSPYPPLSDLLAGHLINPDAQKAMEDDKIKPFLEHRQKAIIDRIQRLMNDILKRLEPCLRMSSGDKITCKITFKAEVPQQKSLQDQQ
jgi:uncharacterized protein with ParB-like and HNH nuclease domain